ncbi:MAG: ABC transporter ATP-binding protein [Marmoricola sp.]
MTTTESTDSSSSRTSGSGGEISGAEIRLEGVTKRYPGQKTAAVDGLSLTIPAGEIVMFVGPSGFGKTTSLKMINRLIEPSSGKITIGDQDVRKQSADELRRHVGYVIQGGSLFPHMTVAKNIAIVPKLLGWDAKRIDKRVEELLDLVNLDPGKYRDRYPRELSGGQQQRVGVARGLAADPPVILMDEPFGAVDPITRQRLQDELLSIQRSLGKTIVCVTHDIDEAIKLGDRILILQEGAQVAQYDAPATLLADPANDFVSDFVGSGSSLKQLTLSRVSEIDIHPATTGRVGEPAREAIERARSAGDDSLVILDSRDRPTAWVWLRQVQGETLHEGDRETLTTLDERATLNDALDTMLTSSHSAAIVTGDNDRYVGIVDFGAVVDHMRAIQNEAQDRESSKVTAESDPEDHHDENAPMDDSGSADE